MSDRPPPGTAIAPHRGSREHRGTRCVLAAHRLYGCRRRTRAAHGGKDAARTATSPPTSPSPGSPTPRPAPGPSASAKQVQAEADAVGEIDWDVSVDSTIVRAHQHAAGARTDPPPALAVPKGASRWNTRTKLRGEASSTGWWRWCRRRGPGAFARRLHQQDPPERGRPLPPVVPDRHTGAAGRLHPVRAGAGEDPGPPAWVGPASQEAGQRRSRQGLQQWPLPSIPAAARHPAHYPGEGRQPGRPPAQGITRRTATGVRRGAVQEAQHRRTSREQAQELPCGGYAV